MTGGSSGIGLWVAIYAARKGADVTIVARNVKVLGKLFTPPRLILISDTLIESIFIINTEKAVIAIRENCVSEEQKIQYYSLDLSKGADIINNAFAEIEKKTGDIYMLVNCAGMAICGTIEDTKPEDAKFLIDLNYLGTFYPIQYVLPKMKANKDGIIVLTASQAGLLGVYGLGAYSASKFALRGLAEALSMETKHLGINVTLALPADTGSYLFYLIFI